MIDTRRVWVLLAGSLKPFRPTVVLFLFIRVECSLRTPPLLQNLHNVSRSSRVYLFDDEEDCSLGWHSPLPLWPLFSL